MTSIDDVRANLKSIEQLVVKASGAEIIFFPENCLFLRVRTTDPVPQFTLTDEVFKHLADLSRKHLMILHLGSVPLICDGSLYNSSVWIYPDGSCKAGYKKIHLFDIDLIGRAPNRESDTFAPGREPVVQAVLDFSFGESICYDVRFSELYKFYADQAVDVILVPAAFLVPTGMAHWHTLLRARAIESQCYVIASAQAGKHQGGSGEFRETFGHSLLIDPWGQVLVDLGAEGSDVLLFEIKRSEIEKVRGQIPMASHRRLFRG